MLRRPIATLLLTLAAAGLLAPAGAFAQANPFTPLPPAPTDTGTTPTTTSSVNTTNADNGGLKRWQELLIFAGGVVLILGIGYAIVHDAHRRAPVADADAYYRDSGDRNDPHAAKRKAQARKKTRAQRKARRANR